MAYRSPNKPPGYFSRLEPHIHLDGGKVSATERIMREVENRWGIPVKVDKIRRWIGGPQRSRFAELYDGHTPKKDDIENLKCFSTAQVGRQRKGVRKAIYYMLNQAEKLVKNTSENMIAEIELPIGRMDNLGRWQEDLLPKGQGIPPRTLRDFEFFTPPPDRSIEIHHKVNIPKITNEQGNPIDLKDMVEAVGEECDLGGLFEFGEIEEHAIRSNSFVGPGALEVLIREQQRHLRHYLDRMLVGRKYELSTLAESTLGLKKI